MVGIILRVSSRSDAMIRTVSERFAGFLLIGFCLSQSRSGWCWGWLSLHKVWSVREVVFSCQGQDQMLGGPIRVTCRERNETGENPEERNPLYHVCLYRIADNAWSPNVRRRYYYCRWSVEEDPDKICCAGEANKGREAHQNIKELLDLVYFAHDALHNRYFSYGRVVTSNLRRPGRFDCPDSSGGNLCS